MSTIINRIADAIAKYEGRSGCRALSVYVGEAEYQEIKQAATAWAPFSPAHDHTDGRARVMGCRLYLVDAKAHLGVA